MKKFLTLAVIVAAALPMAGQQQNDGISRKQADAILDELRQIRQLLEQQAKAGQAPQEQIVKAKVNVGNAPMLGKKEAPLTIVEFTDYQCPFCQRFHSTTFAELKEKYIDTGKIRFYSRDLPLDFHSNAMRAAQAARCATEQNQFWTLREVMSTNPDKLDLDHILNFAANLRLDVGALKNCITSDRYKAPVQGDVMEAMRIGATGTPAFVLGKSTPEGVDGELVLGALPLVMFEDRLKTYGAAQ